MPGCVRSNVMPALRHAQSLAAVAGVVGALPSASGSTLSEGASGCAIASEGTGETGTPLSSNGGAQCSECARRERGSHRGYNSVQSAHTLVTVFGNTRIGSSSS
jgi:hypothetical protein